MRDHATLAHREALEQGDLAQFVVYKSPSDYPDRYVVRMWLVGHQMGPTNLVQDFDTLEEARAFIPEGLFCLPRFDYDDATIVEVWF